MITRYIFLVAIDYLIKAFSKARKLASFSMKDLPTNSSLMLDGVYPYDLVIPNKDLLNVELEQTNLIDSCILGMVVGYTGKEDNNIFSHVKVAHFNSVEYDRPEIRTYKQSDLTVVDSPISAIYKSFEKLSSFSSELKDTGSIQDFSGEDDDDTVH